MQYNDARSLRA